MKRKQTTLNGRNGKHRNVQCPKCSKNIRSNNLSRHMATHNDKKTCKYCKKQIRDDQMLKHEILCKDKVDERYCNRTTGIHQHIEDDPECSSVTGFFNTFTLKINESSDYDVILNESCSAAKEKLAAYLSKHPIKAQLVITLIFYKNNSSGEREESEKAFRSVCEPLLLGDEIDKFLVRSKETIRLEIESYQRYGSGWIYDRHCASRLELAKYNPLAASGSVYIPKKLKKIRSVLNIKSSDNRCFLYCLVAKLFPHTGNNPDRCSKYRPNLDKIDMGDVEFPVKISDIKKIEKLNNISISVFQWHQETEWGEVVVPIKR